MSVHVMLDLESWGTLPGSALRSIGATTFSPYGDCHTEKTFYANIDRESCECAGLVVNDKVFDAARLTGKAAYATVLGILADWRTAQGVLNKAAAAAGRSRVKASPLARTR